MRSLLILTSPLLCSPLARHLARAGVFGLGLALAGACDSGAVGLSEDELQFREELCPQGQCMPGCKCVINGPDLNLGLFRVFDLGGAPFQGKTLTSITRGGTPVSNFSAPLGLPTGTHQGVNKSGAALVGMQFTFTSGTLVLTEVEPSDDELPAYRVKMAIAGGGPVCTDANGQSDWVTMIEDMYWDASGARVDRPNTLTLACQQGAIAKAIHHWGYKLFYPAAAPIHQAATRMIRGDYCGTGHSYTNPGVALSWADVMYEDQPGPGAIEAVWDEHGALCLDWPRSALRATVAQECTIPWCMDLDIETLEDVASIGGLVVSRVLQ